MAEKVLHPQTSYPQCVMLERLRRWVILATELMRTMEGLDFVVTARLCYNQCNRNGHEEEAMAEEVLALRNRIVGLLLRDARERAEKAKRECAAALGVSSGTITAYEEGRKPISLPELEVLSYVLDVPVSYFWEKRDPEELGPAEEPPLQEVLALRHRIVGALLRQARLETDVSRKELADVLGCSPSTITSYEFGRRPVPLSELELLAQRLRLPLEFFLDEQEGPVGEWNRQQEAFARFCELPREMQEFVANPTHVKYLEVAVKLSQMPVGGLRAIAEGLLEITY
jgi:transcriptional regulator with XRE-family HTH domain